MTKENTVLTGEQVNNMTDRELIYLVSGSLADAVTKFVSQISFMQDEHRKTNQHLLRVCKQNADLARLVQILEGKMKMYETTTFNT